MGVPGHVQIKLTLSNRIAFFSFNGIAIVPEKSILVFFIFNRDHGLD